MTLLDEMILPYQEYGANFMHAKKKCILGDCMGSGKCLQVLALINKCQSAKILIVCPKTVKSVWVKEANKWIEETAVSVEGDYEQRKALIEGNQRITVIQYDLVGSKKKYKEVAGVKVIDSVNSQHMLDLTAQKYDVVICDEAHRMRNPRSSQALGMKTIVNHSKPEYLLFLTGTPIVNGGQDVFTALSMIDHKKFSSYWNFVKQHFKLGNRYSPWAIGEMLDPENFRQVLAPYMLRRSKEELNKELPPVTYVTIDVDLDPEQQKYYDQMKKKRSITYKGQTIVASSAMVCLGRLKQIAAGLETLEENSDTPLTGPKVDAIMDILEGAGEQKTLIFSQYARVVKGLYPHCVKLFGKDGVAMFTGADSSKKRLEQEEKLKTPKCKVMLMTFGVGSEGGTYTDASIVICPDLWWTPATNDQAIARVVRKGQTRPVTVYHINTRCTAEDVVTKKLDSKRGLFDSTITKSEVSLLLKEFAKEELGLEEDIKID
jgi:SNF2 family DNA or RNA helicase